MGVKGDQVFKDDIIIKYRGLYDYDGLMALIRDFFAKEKIDLEEPKMKYNMKKTGAEVEFKFQGDRKVSYFIRVYLYVEGHIWDADPKEMTIDGKKVMRTGGKLQLFLNASYEPDFRKRFSKKNKVHRWMKRHIQDPDTGLQYNDIKTLGKSFMQKKLWELDGKIKQFLGMECY
ncbi:MAG: hypothetical protein ACOCZV_00730 [Nanoarchaeota archaeon]